MILEWEDDEKNGTKTLSLIIKYSEYQRALINPYYQAVLAECGKSGKVSDQLRGLVIIAKGIEEAHG